jgi:glycosyltransferase involved in cell wall biosynthesis
VIKLYLLRPKSLDDNLPMIRGASITVFAIVKMLQESGFTIVDRAENADIVLNHSTASDVIEKCREIKKNTKAKIVFTLRNAWTVIQDGDLKLFDSFLVSTKFVGNHYRGWYRINAHSIPLPMIREDVIADKHTRKYLTIVNPIRVKGFHVLLRVLEKLRQIRTDIRVMAIGGVTDKTALSNCYPRVDYLASARPYEIYRDAKLMLIPSVWEEPACRVIAESIVNGIPFAYSGRGGMREVANGAGSIIDIGDSEKWVRWITSMWDRQDLYSDEIVKLKSASSMYDEETLRTRYARYFEEVLN